MRRLILTAIIVITAANSVFAQNGWTTVGPRSDYGLPPSGMSPGPFVLNPYEQSPHVPQQRHVPQQQAPANVGGQGFDPNYQSAPRVIGIRTRVDTRVLKKYTTITETVEQGPSYETAPVQQQPMYPQQQRQPPCVQQGLRLPPLVILPQWGFGMPMCNQHWCPQRQCGCGMRHAGGYAYGNPQQVRRSWLGFNVGANVGPVGGQVALQALPRW